MFFVVSDKNLVSNGTVTISNTKWYTDDTIVKTEEISYDEFRHGVVSGWFYRAAMSNGVLKYSCFDSCDSIVSAYEGCMALLRRHVNLRYTVNGIAISFQDSFIKNCSVPSFVSVLDDDCFAYMTDLETVSLPDNIVVIGNNAFGYCSKLHDINIGKNVERIGETAFAHTGIYQVNIPRSVRYIGCYCFAESKLERVKFEDASAIVFEYRCFQESSITSIDLSGVKKIPEGMFNRCKYLDYVRLDGCEVIEDTAFSDCESLTRIDLPDSLKVISSYAFYKSGLENLTIPDNTRLKTPLSLNGLNLNKLSMSRYTAEEYISLVKNTETLMSAIGVERNELSDFRLVLTKVLRWSDCLFKELEIRD